MQEADLQELAVLDAAASAAPWHVMNTNAGFMSAVFVLKNPSSGRTYEPYGGEAQTADVVAACLLQEPEVAGVDDRRWDANARLIAAVRNHLPELLRLARRGLAQERSSANDSG